MPELSRFFGIIIAMFFDDHNPPHFHARYGGYKAASELTTLPFSKDICRRAHSGLLWNGRRFIKMN